MTKNSPLEEVLRQALGRAGIVTGYEHVCRKKGCGHRELVADAAERRCPVHNHRLWPKAIAGDRTELVTSLLQASSEGVAGGDERDPTPKHSRYFLLWAMKDSNLQPPD